MKSFLFLLLLVNTTISFAFSNRDCKSTSLFAMNSQVLLNKKNTTAQIYFIKNISNDEIMLDHPHAATGVKAGWSSMLAPQHWSVINVSQKDFGLSCASSRNDFKPMSCMDKIKVCQPTTVIKTRKGNFWLIENISNNRFKKWLRQQ